MDIIKSVLNNPMEDYGYGVQKFMQVARELYAEDPYNNIMNKTFELQKSLEKHTLHSITILI